MTIEEPFDDNLNKLDRLVTHAVENWKKWQTRKKFKSEMSTRIRIALMSVEADYWKLYQRDRPASTESARLREKSRRIDVLDSCLPDSWPGK